MLVLFAQQLGIGLLAGRGGGLRSRSQAFKRARLTTPGLYPVASLATAALAFGTAAALHGSGFLAVYLAGLALGAADIPAKRTITAFHEGLAWVAQLGDVPHARPAGVPVGARRGRGGGARCWRSSSCSSPVRSRPSCPPFGSGFSRRERALLGWAGLRGAVPVVLAIFAVTEDVDRADEFFNIVFFAVLLSTRAAGHDDRAVRALARRHDRRAAPRAVGARGRRRARARRRGRRARRPRRRRRGRRAAARPRAAARRARLAHHPRRRGAAPTRLDAAGGRRPPARARPPRGARASSRS